MNFKNWLIKTESGMISNGKASDSLFKYGPKTSRYVKPGPRDFKKCGVGGGPGPGADCAVSGGGSPGM